MKKIFISIFCTALFAVNTNAQTEKDKKEATEEEVKTGFKKENLFVGGELKLGFRNL